LITPLIAAVGGQPNFGKFSFTINQSIFNYGNFLNLLISFLITATVVFFFVVQPVNRLMLLMKRDEPDKPEPTTRPCPECLSDIPKAASRCSFCTAKVAPVTRKPVGA
jgi:large conductance mechanosensitive channel